MTSADIHVNRHDEIAHFRRMLARDAPRFWFIQGDSGVGKSGLLDYLMDEVCAANGTPSVVFDFKDASPTFIHLAVQTGHQVGVRPHIATERCLHDFGVSGVTVDVRGCEPWLAVWTLALTRRAWDACRPTDGSLAPALCRGPADRPA
ncbi:MAG: hypothetical protein IPM84_19470 [Anaerolineae bacterium]|nr:hypothetical protein [Anaerolineae bacterium]